MTLVELLIVVAAMAILAGAIIPEIADSVQQAKRSAMLSDLNLITAAIERYRLEHSAYPPDILKGDSLIQLLSPTDIDGNIVPRSAESFGPYLNSDNFPMNTFNEDATVYVIEAAPPDVAAYSGWIYHVESGRIWAGEAPFKTR